MQSSLTRLARTSPGVRSRVPLIRRSLWNVPSTKARISAALRLAAVVTCGWSLGCPQLLDDEFFQAGLPDDGGPTPDSGALNPDCDSGAPGSCTPGSGGSPARDAQSPASACATGEQQGPSGACYFAQAMELTWQAARVSCQARGAGWALATIRSREDNDFVHDLTGYEAWLGGSDAADEDVWLWVTDDSQFYAADSGQGDLYTNWNTEEPNDNNDSDCLRILSTGFWADLECDSLKGYVCANEAR